MPASKINQQFLKKLSSMAIVSAGGVICFGAISMYRVNEKFYKDFVMPAVHYLDPELSHRVGILAAKANFPIKRFEDSPRLRTKVMGLEFSNPIGLAAGFDKNAEAVGGLMKLGFGFIEVGTVTPNPQPGNPRPRVFRLPEDKAIINRYGFNSDGQEIVKFRLQTSRGKFGVVGVNIGQNKDSSADDYIKAVHALGDISDYLVLNISSPNTPGLRNLQGRCQLEDLIDNVQRARNLLQQKPPILVKIAPDLTEQDKLDIAEAITRTDKEIDGLIVSNTTISRPHWLKGEHSQEQGGLSGKPLRQLSTDTISDMYRLTKGKIPIIGVGGVSSGKCAYEKIRAGASLVQLYSALAYEGPPVVEKVKRELDNLLEIDGFRYIGEAVGADHKSL